MFGVHMTGTALGHGQAPGTLYGIIIEIIESTLNIKYMFLFERETFARFINLQRLLFCL